MSVETNKNLRNAIQIWYCYENPDTALANIMLLYYNAARSVFEDVNITQVITLTELSLISDYINTIQHVNKINEKYLFHLDSANYQLVDQGRKLRELLKFNSSSFVAIAYIVQNKLLKKYIDKNLLDSINLHPYKSKIDLLLNNYIYEGKFEVKEQ